MFFKKRYVYILKCFKNFHSSVYLWSKFNKKNLLHYLLNNSSSLQRAKFVGRKDIGQAAQVELWNGEEEVLESGAVDQEGGGNDRCWSRRSRVRRRWEQVRKNCAHNHVLVFVLNIWLTRISCAKKFIKNSCVFTLEKH